MERKWWKEGIIYQVYPQSFLDTNGDGIGDLPGITRKLDYIRDLGVDIIWLNPVYDSPLDDNGYDIRDYRKINPIYGTMDDFDHLLAEAHKRGLRIIMDLVVNHSSDEHRWFVESRKSADNPYRDFYFWRPGKNGGPPNDWKAFFGGSAWQLDEATGEYYLHYFSKKQPDLNWENPKVREEVYGIVNWWLDKGIDGFRLDVISMLSKYLDFPDAGDIGFVEMFQEYYCNGPRIHEFIQELYERTLSRYDVMTVGEGPGIDREIANLYTGKDRGELNMIFPLDLMFCDWGPGGRFDPGGKSVRDIKRYFSAWDRALGDEGWMSVFLDNHDFPRMVSRFGDDDRHRVESAKCLITMLMTLRGTPSILYGSEIGMTNVAFKGIDEYRDIESINYYREAKASGMAEEEIMRRIRPNGRDNVRTPMQWDDSDQGGFTTGTPWLGVNPNYDGINVEAELGHSTGILAYYKKVIALRKSYLTLTYGEFEDLDPDHEYVFAYERSSDREKFAVYLNLSSHMVTYTIPHDEKRCIISNYPDRVITDQLRPWEARVYRV